MRAALVVAGGVDRGGRERVTPALLWLVERLARRADVTVFVLRYHREPCSYPLLGATVRDLGSPGGLVLQYTALAGALRRFGPFDVVHGYLGLSASVATLAARRLGVPAVATMDSGEFIGLSDIDYGLQLRLRHRLAVRMACRLAHRVTVCTRYQDALARDHGCNPIVIPLGIDPARFVAPLAEGRRDGPPWRLINVASLNRVKDHSMLLDAVQRLTARGIDLHLDIVGEDTLQGAAAAAAERLGIAARVTFHGFQTIESLATLYRCAHLCVLSSRHEAANVSVLEAAASGLATVGTHVGYLAEWAGARASTVPPGDPDALARAIEATLADPAKRSSMAAAARAWTLSHDADWTAERFLDLYRDLTASRQ